MSRYWSFVFSFSFLFSYVSVAGVDDSAMKALLNAAQVESAGMAAREVAESMRKSLELAEQTMEENEDNCGAAAAAAGIDIDDSEYDSEPDDVKDGQLEGLAEEIMIRALSGSKILDRIAKGGELTDVEEDLVAAFEAALPKEELASAIFLAAAKANDRAKILELKNKIALAKTQKGEIEEECNYRLRPAILLKYKQKLKIKQDEIDIIEAELETFKADTKNLSGSQKLAASIFTYWTKSKGYVAGHYSLKGELERESDARAKAIVKNLRARTEFLKQFEADADKLDAQKAAEANGVSGKSKCYGKLSCSRLPHRFALPNCAQTYVKMVSKADAKMIASSARNSELKAEFLKLRSEPRKIVSSAAAVVVRFATVQRWGGALGSLKVMCESGTESCVKFLKPSIAAKPVNVTDLDVDADDSADTLLVTSPANDDDDDDQDGAGGQPPRKKRKLTAILGLLPSFFSDNR